MGLNRVIGLVAGLVVAGAGSEGRAGTMAFVPEPLQKASVVGASMFAADMVGMRVTAGYADGTSATGLWGATGAVEVPGKFLALVTKFGGSPDTGATGTYWSISNTNAASNLVSLSFDGQGDGAGVTAFDVDGLFSGLSSTPGSNAGEAWSPYQTDLTGRWDGDVVYSGEVQLGEAAPVGDLWRSFSISNITWFSFVGVPKDVEVRFRQDSDFSQLTAVPEPAGIGMVGLMMAAGVARLGRSKGRS